jgi:hypothetical protein
VLLSTGLELVNQTQPTPLTTHTTHVQSVGTALAIALGVLVVVLSAALMPLMHRGGPSAEWLIGWISCSRRGTAAS